MRFASIFFVLGGASAIAINAGDAAFSDFKASAVRTTAILSAQGCSIVGCVAALAPNVVACAAAAAEDGANPIADAACIAAAANNIANPPAACAGCFGSSPTPRAVPRAIPW